MQRKRLICLLTLVVLLLSLAPMAVASPAAQADDPSAETLLEQAKALAAEQSPAAAAGDAASFALPAGGDYPLFMGVDDAAVPAYLMDVTNSSTIQAFVGAQVWGSAYDAANDKVYFNNGSTLYEWPVGGAITNLGTMTDPAGATQAMVGLAFYNGTLYGIKNIANEAIYAIDTTTRVATVYIDYTDLDFDLGGFAADPNTGTFYATNDDTTPHGSGLFRMNLDGTGTLIAPYPAGQTDIDGLAVSHDGYAYLVIDEPGNIYVWDFAGAAYTTPLTAPWTSSEVFSGGAWIPPATPDALVCNGAVVGFETGAFPPDWSYTTLALPGGEWVVSMDNSSGFWDPGPAPEGVYYASANDDLPGSGSNGSADYLYTNIIDLSGYSSASLDFAYYFDGAFGQTAGGVEVSGDGGATWDGETIVPTGAAWQTYSLDLSAYAGNNNVQVRFHSNDGGAWASGYAIDDVSLDCTQGDPPNIYVDPLSMASTQPPDVQVQQTLTISNTGGGMLNWGIAEENLSAPDLILPTHTPAYAV
ncbi:MAG TPA: hypothetical protein PKM78_18000, partial [Anaerolineae bacterium]|nr:hypothetical protein [Anaerolineae bacterium]